MFGRIRILAVINDPILTFLLCVKAINIKESLVGSLIFFLEHISAKKNSSRNLGENLFRLGSGRLRKSDLDPVKNCPNPQHWFARISQCCGAPIQCFGSGSALDPHSIGFLDPHSECGSGSGRCKISRNSKKNGTRRPKIDQNKLS
jgi:hypothetical protein